MTIELTGRSILFEGKPVNGRYQAVAAVNSNPSGGTSALGWEAIDGDLNHGSTLRITTDGAKDFGSKVTQEPVIWDKGQDVRFEGVSDSSHSTASDGTLILNAGTFAEAEGVITTSRAHRHSHLDRHYSSESPPKMNADIKYGNKLDTASTSRIFYSSFWIKLPCDPQYLRGIAYSSLSGTFDTGDIGELGEAITITIGGTDYQGNVVDIDSPESGIFFIYSPQQAIGSDTIVDVVGNVSGATATLDSGLTGFNSASSAKMWRMNQEQDDGILTVAQIANSQFWIESNSAGSDAIGMNRYANNILYGDAAADGDWVFAELFVDWSVSTDLKADFRLVGSKGETRSIITGIDGSVNYLDVPVKVLKAGLDNSVSQAVHIDFGEVIADETPQRVAITDANTFAASTIREIQFTKSWSSNQIDVELYHGAFSGLSGKYLYWFDADNNPELIGAL